MTNVLRIVVLGGSICCILRGTGALGAPDSYRLFMALRDRVGPLKTAWFRGLETLEAESDECLKDCGPGRLNLLYSTRFGGSGSSRCLPPSYGLKTPGGSA